MSEGIKHDQGKRSPTRERELPLITRREALALFDMTSTSASIVGAADVIAHGALKYGAGNWKKLSDARRRYSDAYYRHSMSEEYYPESPDRDIDSGMPHRHHALTNLIFLMHEFDEEKVSGNA